MTDIVKVINSLDDSIKNQHCGFVDGVGDVYAVSEETIKNVISMLKEKEAKEQCLKTKCVICPHCDNCDVDENGFLKEQEAVAPRRIDGKRNHFIKCGNCNYDLVTGFKFCPHCGKAVKLNEID